MSRDEEFDEHARQFLSAVEERRGRGVEDVGAFLYHLKEGVAALRKLCDLRENPAKYGQAEAENLFNDLFDRGLPNLLAAESFCENSMYPKRPGRLEISREETLRRMAELPKRAEKMIAAIRKARKEYEIQK